MHLLQAQAGAVADGSQAVDLGQTPAEVIFLSAADSELAVLAGARALDGERLPGLRLANLMQLSHPMSVDLYVEQVIAHARLVVVRLLGGVGYWPYGVERLVEVCAAHGVALALLPGDDQPDAELSDRSTVGTDAWHRLWQYWVHGGVDNARGFLGCCAALLGREWAWGAPAARLLAGVDSPGCATPAPGGAWAAPPASAACSCRSWVGRRRSRRPVGPPRPATGPRAQW